MKPKDEKMLLREPHYFVCTTMGRDLDDYIRAEYRQIAIMVGSTTIGRVGILSV